MKHPLLLACLCLAMASCNNSEKTAAGRLIDTASRQALAGDYNGAKATLDSVKLVAPKAYDLRHKALALKREYTLLELQRDQAYTDSVLRVSLARLDSLRPGFAYEKDTAYQRTGRYLYPTQTVERNLGRAFLRFQTDEEGRMSLTSIYCGARHVHHAAVRVIAPDGTYAQTPPSPDSYETSVQGTMIEQADYRLGEDGNVADFVRQNHDKDLKLQFLGDQNFTTRLSPDDRKAAVEVYRLSRLLTLIADTRRQQEELQTKRKFIEEADRRQTGEKP